MMRVKDIERFMGCDYRKAKKIFNVAKKIDNDPYHLRETQVPTSLVLDVLNLNQGFVMKQIALIIKKELPEEFNSTNIL